MTNEDEDDPALGSRTRILLLLLFICTITLMVPNTTYADTGISAYNIQVTEDYVTSTGVCSCVLMTDRKHHKASWVNMCPMCGRHGTLTFEEGSYPYTSPEGMWYCTSCDADYDLVHGSEHGSPPRAYLSEYTIPLVEKIRVSSVL